MAKELTQRELRNRSGDVMRAIDRGEAFIVTRNGVPVAELVPISRRNFVPAEILKAVFAGSPRIDAERFARDVDRFVDQDPTPRA
jgi:prevent-host-death family protein